MRISFDLADRLAFSVHKKERAQAASVVQAAQKSARAQGDYARTYLLTQVEQKLRAINNGKGLVVDIRT
jgi:hypothetical protein